MSRLKATLLFALLLFGVARGAQTAPAASATAEAIPADPAQLRELIAGLDRKMFDAYNVHDVDGSLEVYPIKGFGAIEIGAWKVSRDVSYGH